MARSRDSQTVTLFPFLAVLVCTMGALILILLVTTRRIRQQTLAAAEAQTLLAAREAKRASPPPVLAIAPPVVEDLPDDTPLFPLFADDEVVFVPPPLPVVVPPPPPPLPPPLPPPPPRPDPRIAQREAHEREQAALNREWEAKIDDLSRRHAAALSAAQAIEAEIQSRQQAVDRLTSQLSAAESRRQAAVAEAADVQRGLADLNAQRAALRAEIDDVSQQLERLLSRRKATASTKYTFVPFDALSGTTRRPLVLECRGDRVVFVSEGITLTASDLDGFIPHYNPLQAGVKALSDAWQKRDAAERDPYILFIVRPDGTISYYIARLFLESLGIEFGYELVASDRELVWPQSDAELVAACREAIDEVLRDRHRVPQLAQLGGRDESPFSIRGGDGQFRLDEVERLRQPARTVSFGGQQIDRNEYTQRNPVPPGGGSTDNQRWSPLKRLTGGRPEASDGVRGASGKAPSQNAEPPAPKPSPTTKPTASAGSSSQGQDAAEPSAPRPPVFESTNRDDVPRPVRRPGGLSPVGTGISVQRDVKIHVSAGEVRIGEQRPIAWDQGRLSNTAAARVAAGIEQELRDWGPPPRGFSYKPRLAFIVSPGATQRYVQLKALATEWGVENFVKYVSE
jgi:hypothetical protein